MRWFRRKPDPITAREESLQAEIAAIEAEIRRLNGSLGTNETAASPKKGSRKRGGSQLSSERPMGERAPSGLPDEDWGGDRSAEGLGKAAGGRNPFHRSQPSNPRMVNYLAAGSIEGLRPLRYERRIARNRAILLTLVLAGILWVLVSWLWPG